MADRPAAVAARLAELSGGAKARRPLRILMFMGYYLPYVSGAIIYAQRLSEGLVQHGHQVTILCAHHQKDTPL